MTHQGPTVGYRIEEARQGARLPARTTNPRSACDLADQPPDWISGYEVAHDADVLFHDAQYGDDEYPHHVGWGHSCIDHVSSSRASSTSARSCSSITTRTTPTTSSKRCSTKTRQQWHGTGDRVCLAHEGMTVTLDAAGTTFAV